MPLSLSAAISTTISTTDPPVVSAASIAKNLASPNPSIRNRTVRKLSSLLPALAPLPQSTLLKIWKGLFFCYWHSDKPLYQSNLATSISSLISSNGPDLATSFLDASLLTLRREWGSIDFLRMDKFYLLVRRILKHTFLLLKSNCWDSNLVFKIMSIIEERALGEEGVKGFSYHVVEIFLEELNGFLPVKKEVLEVITNPFLMILEKSTDSILVNKAKVSIFDKFLVNGAKYLSLKKSGGEIERRSEVALFGIIGLIMGFSEKLLDLAKREETVQANKKVLHDLRDGFFKLEKDLKKGEIEIEILVPEEIEICEVAKIENGEGSDEKVSKKRKKKNNKGKKELGEKKEKKNSEKKNKKKKMKTQEKSNNMSSEEDNNNNTTGTNECKTEDAVTASSNGDERESESMVNFDETLISNLQKQFEKAAAEDGMPTGDSISSPITTTKATKKRKQAKNSKKSEKLEMDSEEGNPVSTEEEPNTSIKKVRFSIQSNVVWKPSTPLPPVSLRLPPSATPRGSALKKGVPAGPIRQMESPVGPKRRRVKAKSVKKGLKSPSLAKLRKMQNMSA